MIKRIKSLLGKRTPSFVMRPTRDPARYEREKMTARSGNAAQALSSRRTPRLKNSISATITRSNSNARSVACWKCKVENGSVVLPLLPAGGGVRGGGREVAFLPDYPVRTEPSLPLDPLPQAGGGEKMLRHPGKRAAFIRDSIRKVDMRHKPRIRSGVTVLDGYFRVRL